MKTTPKQSLRVKTRRLPTSTIAFGFDRMFVHLDIADVPPEARALVKAPSEILPGDMPFSPHWQIKLDLHQPSTSLLKKLAVALQGHAQVLINYVESAVDYLPPFPITAKDAAAAVLESLHPAYVREPAKLDKHGTTFYYGRRAGENERKSSRVVALYAHKPSKLASTTHWAPVPCLHLECRVSGKDAVESAGIITLHDAVEFHHEAFLQEAFRFVKPVASAKIARWCKGSEAATMTASQLTRAGDAWKERHMVNQMFCLHNGWIEGENRRFFSELPTYPDIRRLLRKLETGR